MWRALLCGCTTVQDQDTPDDLCKGNHCSVSEARPATSSLNSQVPTEFFPTAYISAGFRHSSLPVPSDNVSPLDTGATKVTPLHTGACTNDVLLANLIDVNLCYPPRQPREVYGALLVLTPDHPEHQTQDISGLGAGEVQLATNSVDFSISTGASAHATPASTPNCHPQGLLQPWLEGSHSTIRSEAAAGAAAASSAAFCRHSSHRGAVWTAPMPTLRNIVDSGVVMVSSADALMTMPHGPLALGPMSHPAISDYNSEAFGSGGAGGGSSSRGGSACAHALHCTTAPEQQLQATAAVAAPPMAATPVPIHDVLLGNAQPPIPLLHFSPVVADQALSWTAPHHMQPHAAHSGPTLATFGASPFPQPPVYLPFLQQHAAADHYGPQSEGAFMMAVAQTNPTTSSAASAWFAARAAALQRYQQEQLQPALQQQLPWSPSLNVKTIAQAAGAGRGMGAVGPAIPASPTAGTSPTATGYETDSLPTSPGVDAASQQHFAPMDTHDSSGLGDTGLYFGPGTFMGGNNFEALCPRSPSSLLLLPRVPGSEARLLQLDSTSAEAPHMRRNNSLANAVGACGSSTIYSRGGMSAHGGGAYASSLMSSSDVLLVRRGTNEMECPPVGSGYDISLVKSPAVSGHVGLRAVAEAYSSTGSTAGYNIQANSSKLFRCLLVPDGAAVQNLPPPEPAPSAPITAPAPSTTAAHLTGGQVKILRLQEVAQDLDGLEFLGAGAGGAVYKTKWRGVTAAVKFMAIPTMSHLTRGAHEAALSRVISHPNLIQTFFSAMVVLDEPDFPSHSSCATPSKGVRTVSGSGRGIRRGSVSYGNVRDALATGSPSFSRDGYRGYRDGDAAAAFDAAEGVTSEVLMEEEEEVDSREALARAVLNTQELPAIGAADGDDSGGITQIPMDEAENEDVSLVIKVTAIDPEDHQPQPAAAAGMQPAPLGRAKRSSSSSSSPLVKLSYTDFTRGSYNGGSRPQLGGNFSQAVLQAQLHQMLTSLHAKPGMMLAVIIMEHCDGGSLQDKIARGVFGVPSIPKPAGRLGSGACFRGDQAVRSVLRTAREVALAMLHLHCDGVLHGDLKPGNVLLTGATCDGRGGAFLAKVGDFGTSRLVSSGGSTPGDFSTPAFMAPEAMDGQLMRESDVYSYGMLLYQLVSGETPFQGMLNAQIVFQVQSKAATLDWPTFDAPSPAAMYDDIRCNRHPKDPNNVVRHAGGSTTVLLQWAVACRAMRALCRLGQLCVQHDAKQRPPFPGIVEVVCKIEDQLRNDTRAVLPRRDGAHASNHASARVSPCLSSSARSFGPGCPVTRL